MNKTSIIIKQYLTLFELPLDKVINENIIESQFKKLSQIYHCNQANHKYSDEKKFIELKITKDYLLANIDNINILILSNFNGGTQTNNYYHEEQKIQQEVEKKKPFSDERAIDKKVKDSWENHQKSQKRK